VSLADALADALPELRAAAESLMADRCTVTRPGVGAPTVDEGTGALVQPAGTPVYAGRCRVQVPNVAERDADAGERSWTVQAALVVLPVAGSEQVRVGDVVTVTAAVNDRALLGARYVVKALHAKTHATARRLRCEAVS
jgi:predicted RecA/RadA family phage recombinase